MVFDIWYSDGKIDKLIRENYAKRIDEGQNVGGLPHLTDGYFVDDRDLEYYIRWRTRLRDGDCPSANSDMVRFFFRELSVMNEPEETVDNWIARMKEAYRDTEAGEMAYLFGIRTMLVRHGLPERLEPLSHGTVRPDIELLLAGPSVELDEVDVKNILGDDGALPPGSVDFVNVVLENIAASVWDEMDIGLVEYLSNYREEAGYWPLGRTGSDPAFIIDRPLLTERALTRLANIIRYCMSVFGKGTGKRSNRVNENIKTIVKRSLVQWREKRERPDEWLPLRTICTYPFDGRELGGIYQRGDGTMTCEPHPIVYDVPYILAEKVSTDRWNGTTVDFFGSDIVDRCEYVASPHCLPVFTEMSGEQLSYYRHWRREFAKGNHLDTDQGYLSLLMMDTMKSGKDPKDRMATLLKIAEAYPVGMVKETCMSFALTNDLDLPPYCESRDCNWLFVATMRALETEPITKISPMEANSVADRYVDESYILVDYMLLTSAFNYLINRFDASEKEACGKRLCERAENGGKFVEVCIYDRLYRYGISENYNVLVRNHLADERVYEIFTVSFATAVRYVCQVNDCASPRMFADADASIVRQASEFMEEFGTQTDTRQ